MLIETLCGCPAEPSRRRTCHPPPHSLHASKGDTIPAVIALEGAAHDAAVCDS